MQTTWDLKQTLPDRSPENIAKLKQESEYLINSFAQKYSTNLDYLTSAAVLLESLLAYENIIGYDPANQLGQYFSLSLALDQSNPEYLSQMAQLTSWGTALGNKIQFYSLNLAKIDKLKQAEFLKDAPLSHYHKFLKHIFDNAKYNLTEPEEKILNIISPFASGNWFGLTQRLLSEESSNGKNLPQLLSLCSDIDKQIRDSANSELIKILDKHKLTAEVEINNLFGYKKELDSLRKVSRPDLARHISDDISTDTVDALRQTVADNFQISKDYYQLKAELFGLKKLRYHDRNVPYGSIDVKHDINQSYDLVYKVFDNLSPDFSKVLQDFFNDKRVDVLPKKGKQGGAFCTMGSKNTAGFVMLNHTDKLQDTLTLAHEFGHAVNHELIKQNSTPIYMENSLATAEVASTFFEDFVLEEVSKTASDEQLLSIYMNRLNGDVSTIFRQVACYQFEWELHREIREKGHLSWQQIGQVFQKNMASYMGDFVEQSQGCDLFWIYWEHIRMSFYVYSYASGLLVSKSLQALVKQDPKSISKVKTFLSTGTNKSPAQIFSELGLDINSASFWDTGLGEVRTLLEKTRSLAVKLGKI